jgi:4-amino-4-deoxy-L-arabinose transferase-like glycosyltransferase
MADPSRPPSTDDAAPLPESADQRMPADAEPRAPAPPRPNDDRPSTGNHGTSPPSRDRLSLLLVLLVATTLYLPGLGDTSLFDRDEPRFAAAARSMMERGEWFVPHFNGELRLHKPVLIYWVMIAGYRTFGVNALGARIGSALAGILTCGIVLELGRRMFNRRVGLLAGLVMATSLQHFVIARAATADSVLIAAILLAMLGAWLVHEGDRSWRGFILLYAGLALGGLTKGPVAYLVVLPTLLAVAVWERSGRYVRDLRLHVGIPLSLVVILAWLIPAEWITAYGFTKVGLGHHVGHRAFGGAMEGHSGPIVYYLGLLPISFFPWFVFLPLSLVRFWQAARSEAKGEKTSRRREGGLPVSASRERRARPFLICWAGFTFLMFSVIKTKLPHYVLPGYPALAILVAWGVDAAIRGRFTFWPIPNCSVCDAWRRPGPLLSRCGRAARASLSRPLGSWICGTGGLLALGLSGGVMAVGALAYPWATGAPGAELPFAGAGLAAGAMTALVLLDLSRRRTRRAVVVLVLGMCLLGTTVARHALPDLDHRSSARQLVREIRRHGLGDHELTVIGYKEPTLVFYWDRHVEYLRKHWDLLEWRLRLSTQPISDVAQKNRMVCLARTRALRGMPPELAARFREVARFRSFLRPMGRWEEFAILVPKESEYAKGY